MTTLTASLVRSPATTMAPWLDTVLRAAFLGVLLVAPVPLGCAGGDLRAWLVVALGGTSLLVTVAAMLRHQRLSLPPASLPLLLVACVLLLQTLPIATVAGSGPLADIEGTHLSLVPVRTWTRFGELLGCFTCFCSASILLTKTQHARGFVAALLALAVGLVIYGLFAWQGVAPLVDADQTRTVMVATFVNRNHLANLLGMAALAGLGLFGALRCRRTSGGLLLLVAGGITVACLGIVATQSRGGLLALGAGCIAYVVLAVRTHRRLRTFAALGLCLGLGLVFWLLPVGFANRFVTVGTELQSSGTRTDIWRGAFALWQTSPWLGTGLGTFGDLSPATQSAAVPGRVEHAHNDPLELLAETGVVGVFVLVAALLAFAVPVVRRCLAHTDRERALLAAGGLAALTACGVHSLVEFHLQIPANAAWTAALAGLVVGVLRSRRPSAAPLWHTVVLVGLAALAVVSGLHRACTRSVADGLQAIERGRAVLASDPASAAAAAATALRQNQFSPRAHRLAGEAALGTDSAAAQAAFARSLRWTNPAECPQAQLEIALVCLVAGDARQSAHWLGDLLPRRTDAQQQAALATMYDTVPAAEVLLGLLPKEPLAVRHNFAEVLLHRGDFVGREQVLAGLRREPIPALLTVSDTVRLTGAEAPLSVTASGTTAAVALTFVREPGSTPAPLVLRCEGPGAAIYRSFSTDSERFAYTAQFDTTFPPGEYTLSLDFRADAPHFPFGNMTIAEADLDLRRGDTVPATSLYWTTGEPGRRIHPEHCVPLRSGDVAWRNLLLPEGPCDLVLRTQAPTQLAVRFGERELAPPHLETATIHRFELPLATTGRLEVRATQPDAPVLRELFVVTRSAR